MLKVSVKEREKAIIKYKEEFNISSPIVIDKTVRVANAYGVWSHPNTFFINRKGMIVGRILGGRNWISRGMRNFIQSLLDKKMETNQIDRIFSLSFFFFLSLFVAGCATSMEEIMPMNEAMPMNEGMTMMKTFPKNRVFPLSEINLEKVIEENRGMKVLKENATTVCDYYRGGVQEKAEGERLLKDGHWEKAMHCFIQSNRFLEVVVDYLPEDESYRNIYEGHFVIYMPNLLIADNQLKLMKIYRELKMEDDIYWAKRKGMDYLARSLKSVRTEWGYRVKKEIEESFQKEESLKK
jgi:hypothetical protein